MYSTVGRSLSIKASKQKAEYIAKDAGVCVSLLNPTVSRSTPFSPKLKFRINSNSSASKSAVSLEIAFLTISYLYEYYLLFINVKCFIQIECKMLRK